MPLVHLDILACSAIPDREAIAGEVCDILVADAGAPADDNLVVSSAPEPTALVMDRHFTVRSTMAQHAE
ncbi:hypothetical protein [Intrasporangium sp.]|uniref:hypothetical protein n=1 Tax=Intrasporangium sp. TaxID=1925024 RepID=UPI0032216147